MKILLINLNKPLIRRHWTKPNVDTINFKKVNYLLTENFDVQNKNSIVIPLVSLRMFDNIMKIISVKQPITESVITDSVELFGPS